jgi:hypothetical protein
MVECLIASTASTRRCLRLAICVLRVPSGPGSRLWPGPSVQAVRPVNFGCWPVRPSPVHILCTSTPASRPASSVATGCGRDKCTQQLRPPGRRRSASDGRELLRFQRSWTGAQPCNGRVTNARHGPACAGQERPCHPASGGAPFHRGRQGIAKLVEMGAVQALPDHREDLTFAGIVVSVGEVGDLVELVRCRL